MLQQHGALWRTGRLSLENLLPAVSFCGLARSNFCLSGRLPPEPADFAPVLPAASVFWAAPLPLSWSGRVTLDPVDLADMLYSASFLGIIHSHFCLSSRCGSARSFVPVLWAACTRMRRPCCTAEEAGQPVLKEIALCRGQKLERLGAWSGVVK